MYNLKYLAQVKPNNNMLNKTHVKPAGKNSNRQPYIIVYIAKV